MKRLIVNADDLGVSAKRNLGIVEAHHRGVVTSASIIANGAAFDHAASLANLTPALDVGLHLNLSDGRPLLDGHRTLVGPNGAFPGKIEARERARQGKLDPIEVESEASAQLKAARQSGLRVSHLDGHQHIHVYGSVVEAVAKAAAREGVRYVRLPVDTLGPEEFASEARREQLEDYRKNSASAAPVYRRFRLRSTDHFGGAALTGALTLESLVTALKSLRDGLTELMVHPGLAEGAEGFEGADREKELRALTDPRIKLLLQQEGIELTHFGRLAQEP